MRDSLVRQGKAFVTTHTRTGTRAQTSNWSNLLAEGHKWTYREGMSTTAAPTASPIATITGPMPCQHCIAIALQWDAQIARIEAKGLYMPKLKARYRDLARSARACAQTHRTVSHVAA